MKLPPGVEAACLRLADRIDGRPVKKPGDCFPKKARTEAAVATAGPLGWAVTLTVPVRVVSEPNARSYWAARHTRFKAQGKALGIAWQVAGLRTWQPVTWPVRVTLTRLGGQRMDGDNLQGSFKGCRDSVAALLAVDDGDAERVTWRYDQEPAAVEGVKVTIAGGA